jgi:CRP/FNR family transcriptional regulator, cyclic AMP receptor protein
MLAYRVSRLSGDGSHDRQQAIVRGNEFGCSIPNVGRQKNLHRGPTMKSKFDPNSYLARHGGAVASTIAEKHIIFSQGDVADCIYYIQKGQIQLTVVSMEGKEAVIAIAEAGDFCGEGCLIGETQRMSTAATITECVLTRLEKATVLRAIREDSDFSEFLVTYVLKRTARLTDALIDQLFNSSEKRLARVLLLLANYGKEDRAETVIGRIDQETLAQMIGATRTRVNFFMNKFRRLGLIEYNGQIHVNSSLLRVVLHDQPLAAPGEAKPPAG